MQGSWVKSARMRSISKSISRWIRSRRRQEGVIQSLLKLKRADCQGLSDH